MKKEKLGIIADYSDTSVNCIDLTITNYISSENMKQNKRGIENSLYLPRVGNVTEYIKNDILIGNIRPYLKKIWFATNNGGSSNDVLVLRVFNENYDKKFVYYNLFQDDFFKYVMQGKKGSKMPRGDKNHIKHFELPVLQLSTQKAIAHVLSILDDKIELNNKINIELENLARTLYQWYFVQNHKDDWDKKLLEELLNEPKGGDWGKELAQGNYTKRVICIRGTDMDTLLSEMPQRYILEKNNNKLLTEGDIIVEISGGSPTQSTGRMTLILRETLDSFGLPLVCSNFCKAISLKDNKLTYYFSILWKELYDKGIFFRFEGKTNGIKNLLFDIFAKTYKVIIPDDATLIEFNNAIKPIYSQIARNRSQSIELAALRDFLLPMLMNGQVTIDDKNSQTENKVIKFPSIPTYEEFKGKIEVAARDNCGEFDEKTLRSMYKAHYEKVVANDKQCKKK